MPVPLFQRSDSNNMVVASVEKCPDGGSPSSDLDLANLPLKGKCTLNIPHGHALEAAQIFLKNHYEASPHDYDDCDIQRVKDYPEWHVGRFYHEDRSTPTETADALATNLQWRHTYGINDLSEDKFPAEYYQTGGIFVGGRDIAGARLLVMRIKMNRSCNKSFDQLLEKYLAWIFNRVDLETAYDGYAAGWSVILDCTGAGISNVNMDILKFIVASLTTHFPSSVSYVMGYNLPWILNSVWKVVRSWLPAEHQERVKFSSTKDVRQGDLIAADQWPVFCDPEWGTWDCSAVKKAPTSALCALDIAKEEWGVTKESELKKIETHFINLLQIKD